MPRGDIQSLLDYEAKRSLDLAHMIDNLSQLSDEAIRAAHGFLPWIRVALLDRKKRNNYQSLATQMEPFIIASQTPDRLGETRRWEAGSMFIRLTRGHLEMKSGQLIWLDGTGVWIDTIHVPTIDPLLWQHTVSCGHMSRSTYMEANRQRNVGSSPQVNVADTIRDPMSAVRIFRPG
jgi:hypothetical protein